MRFRAGSHGKLSSLCCLLAVGPLLLASFSSKADTAPGYDANMPQPGPYEEKLDALLAATDTDTLNHEILFDIKDMETATRGLDWLRAKQILTGGGSHIAYLYSALSWRISNSLPEPQKTKLMQNAVAELILAKWLIQSEGSQCADAAAPGARMGLLDSQLKPIAQYGAQIPAMDQNLIVRNMFGVMMISFKKRGNDVWMCRGGTRYLVKYFEKHPDEKGVDVSVPGSVGNNKMLPLDPTTMPDFVPYETWRDKRHSAIDQILKKTGGVPPSDYLDAQHKMM